MTTLSPPPARENVMQSAEPASRWRRLIPRSRRGKTAIAGGLAVLLVAGCTGRNVRDLTRRRSVGCREGGLSRARARRRPGRRRQRSEEGTGHPRQRAAAHTRSADRRPHVTQSGQAGLGLPVTITSADQPAEPLFATDTTTSAVHARFGAATARAASTTSCTAGRRPGQPAADTGCCALLGIPDHG